MAPETTDTPVETTPESPIGQIIVNLPTPVYQACGGQVYKLLFETIANQVKMSDGISVETRLTTLERAVTANTKTHFADNIAERDSLRGLIPGDFVYVADAAADDTVEKGAATYLYMSDLTFRKVSESESMDIVFKWDNIEGKPASAPDDIDTAVLRQHNHANKTELDALSDDGTGLLLYKGRHINDGLVDVATASAEGIIPDNLRDGGLLIINPAVAGTGE